VLVGQHEDEVAEAELGMADAAELLARLGMVFTACS
jgi:hypothetical protein